MPRCYRTAAITFRRMPRYGQHEPAILHCTRANIAAFSAVARQKQRHRDIRNTQIADIKNI
jgi:hypothetical protein